MEYYNYADLKNFVKDEDIIETLCIEEDFEQLLSYYTSEDFLEIDNTMRIPFFAETRDYIGAREKDNPKGKWLVKRVNEKQQTQTEMGMICFFVDFFTKTLSAPIVLTKIDGEFYKATKLVNRAEQLSGANYVEIRQLREQLLLDLINRWIYSDEDRNPNNYMVRYNSHNDQLVIAVDFLNVDLEFEGIKIKGTKKEFGWQRMEKTRYLTPLKVENFLIYEMKFFEMRFQEFNRLNSKILNHAISTILKHNSERKSLTPCITDNLLVRRDYLYDYFKTKIPEHVEDETKDKYKDFGKVFGEIYNKYD